MKTSELDELPRLTVRKTRRNRVHQRKLERLDNRNHVNSRKLGIGYPIQGEWILARHSHRIKDFVRHVHQCRNRTPKTHMPV